MPNAGGEWGWPCVVAATCTGADRETGSGRRNHQAEPALQQARRKAAEGKRRLEVGALRQGTDRARDTLAAKRAQSSGDRRVTRVSQCENDEDRYAYAQDWRRDAHSMTAGSIEARVWSAGRLSCDAG